jgi:hypothetical protein
MSSLHPFNIPRMKFVGRNVGTVFYSAAKGSAYPEVTPTDFCRGFPLPKGDGHCSATKKIFAITWIPIFALVFCALNCIQRYPCRCIHRALAKLCHFEPRLRHVACCHVVGLKFSWLFFAWVQKHKSSSVFYRGTVSAYSTQTGHLFQTKLDTCSTPNWTPWAQRRGVEVWFYSGRGELVKLARFFRSESPFKLSWWALWTRRSRMASARVASPMAACQWSIGS